MIRFEFRSTNKKYQPFPHVVIFFRGCVPEVIVPLYAVSFIYISGKLGFVPLLLCSLNPLRAKFLRDNINIYLHFMSFLHTNKTQVVDIPPRVRQAPAYST